MQAGGASAPQDAAAKSSGSAQAALFLQKVSMVKQELGQAKHALSSLDTAVSTISVGSPSAPWHMGLTVYAHSV